MEGFRNGEQLLNRYRSPFQVAKMFLDRAHGGKNTENVLNVTIYTNVLSALSVHLRWLILCYVNFTSKKKASEGHISRYLPWPTPGPSTLALCSSGPLTTLPQSTRWATVNRNVHAFLPYKSLTQSLLYPLTQCLTEQAAPIGVCQKSRTRAWLCSPTQHSHP